LTKTTSLRESSATTNTIRSSIPYASDSTEQTLKIKGSYRAPAGMGSSDIFRGETGSRKAFALQDKVFL